MRNVAHWSWGQRLISSGGTKEEELLMATSWWNVFCLDESVTELYKVIGWDLGVPPLGEFSIDKH